jgi:hypothetical protein
LVTLNLKFSNGHQVLLSGELSLKDTVLLLHLIVDSLLDELLLHFKLSHQGGSLVRVIFSLDSSAEFLGFVIKLFLLFVGLNLDFFLDSMVSHLKLFVLLHQELGLVDFDIFRFLLSELRVEVLVLRAGLIGDTLHA